MAHVYAIDYRVDEETRSIGLRAKYNNSDRRLVPGMYASVTLITEERTNAIQVPTQAVVPEMNEKRIWLLHSGKAVYVPIVAGIRTDQTVEVLSGINPGDTVITSGLMQLRPKMAVKCNFDKLMAEHLQISHPRKTKMSLSSLSIKRPVLATVMSLVILILGGIGFSYLGVRDYPSVDPPIVTVSTSFPGANADVIETQITEPLESAINGVQGIRSISSSSSDGSSRITVEFNLEVEMETAVNDVRDKVSGAMRQLPADVDPPVVQKADADAQPIYGVSLRSNSRSLIDLSTYAEINFKERLQTVPGVSAVDVWGSKKLAVRLKMDPSRLDAYGLTPLDVRIAVTQENIELPSGRIEGNNTELTVRTYGRLRSIDEFNDLIIARKGNRVVKFSDIGIAEIAPENIRSILKGQRSSMRKCRAYSTTGSKLYRYS